MCDTHAGWGIQIPTSVFYRAFVKSKKYVFRHILEKNAGLKESKKPEVRIGKKNFWVIALFELLTF
jgi:hypothetical protein